MQTTIQELIREFEMIKDTKCKTLQETVFFDGILAIIESKYIEKEKNNLIDFHIEVMKIGLIEEGGKKWTESYEPKIKEVATNFYNENFNNTELL